MEIEIINELRRKLKSYLDKGYTYYELAMLCDVSTTAITNFLYKKTRTNPRVIAGIKRFITYKEENNGNRCK